MKIGKFNVVTDAQWGSCAKGQTSSALVERYRPNVISTTNSPNAGHSAVNVDESKFIGKALPAGSIMNVWTSGYRPGVWVGPAASFYVDRMLEEIRQCGLTKDQVKIHPRAGVVTEEHRKAEAIGGKQSTVSIASTMQGTAAFASDKILRKPGLKLARDYVELQEFIAQDMFNDLHGLLSAGGTILHEGAQGFSLDISWGSHYPFCTSRSTTALQNAADMGIPPKLVGDVYLVLRPWPIRVGNVIEGGVKLGDSGGCYKGQEEITWEQVAKEAGMPDDEAKSLLQKELTTVTKRLRRVFTFSDEQLRLAAAINGATHLVLNFANYIDWSCHGCSEWSELPQKVLDFAGRCEQITGVKVAMMGTGPRWCDVCWRPRESSLEGVVEAVSTIDGETA